MKSEADAEGEGLKVILIKAVSCVERAGTTGTVSLLGFPDEALRSGALPQDHWSANSRPRVLPPTFSKTRPTISTASLRGRGWCL